MKKLFYLNLAIGAILMFTNCDNTSVEPINTSNHINFTICQLVKKAVMCVLNPAMFGKTVIPLSNKLLIP